MSAVAVRVPMITLPDQHWKVGDFAAHMPDNGEGYQIGQLVVFNHEPEKISGNLMEIIFYDTKGKAEGSVFVRSIPRIEGLAQLERLRMPGLLD